jgi:hypothetical protein
VRYYCFLKTGEIYQFFLFLSLLLEVNVKKIIFLTLVLYLITGFIGYALAPKYVENSEVPWKVFYSVRTNMVMSKTMRTRFNFVM